MQKISYRCKQQPIVPLGVLATCVAVAFAAKGVRTGNRQSAQKWFRWRVGLQGVTVAALVGGSLVYDQAKVSKGEDELAREKAKMRERLWIEELERRDDEEKQRRQRAALARSIKLQAQSRDEE